MSALHQAFEWSAFAVLCLLLLRVFLPELIVAIRHALTKDISEEEDTDYLTDEEEEFLQLSREMYRHSRGQDFEQAMRTFPSEKFHRWLNLGSQI